MIPRCGLSSKLPVPLLHGAFQTRKSSYYLSLSSILDRCYKLVESAWILSSRDLDIHGKTYCHHWPLVSWKNFMAFLDHVPINSLPSPTRLKHLSENIKSLLDMWVCQTMVQVEICRNHAWSCSCRYTLILFFLASVASKEVQQRTVNNILNNSWTPTYRYCK